jgi:tRNA dimethylallyltransferase
MWWVITGPTGSGKTRVALQAARDLKLPLVNADVFQFYRDLPILSNQPSELEREGVRCEWLGHRSLEEPVTAGQFGRALENDRSRDLVLAGTGLFVGAALFGLDAPGTKGTPFQNPAAVEFQMLVLNPDRADLYEALNKRVDEMMSQGAMEEAQKIWMWAQEDPDRAKLPALKAIGLKQLIQYQKGELSLDRAVELWKQETRRLAKRQWTWLRKFCPPSPQCQWVDPKSFEFQAYFK